MQRPAQNSAGCCVDECQDIGKHCGPSSIAKHHCKTPTPITPLITVSHCVTPAKYFHDILSTLGGPLYKSSLRGETTSPRRLCLRGATIPDETTSADMATITPLSPGGRIQDFVLPLPPPLLHTRSGNELYDGPHTPLGNGFTTPTSTPQGSPSKNKLPPGANDLPNVFENAMKLVPSSPIRAGRQQLSPHSPNKGGRQVQDGNVEDDAIRQQHGTAPGSPTRKSNKENTPPGARLVKEISFTNQAALSRQEPYQTRDTSEVTSRPRYNTQRGLTPEELEKLQLPKVKRLANVTQLCGQRSYPATSVPSY